MKRRRCDSPFSFRSTVPVHAYACMYTRAHVCACIYKPREHHGDLRFVLPLPLPSFFPLAADFLRQLSPPYLTLFSLPPYSVPRSLPPSLRSLPHPFTDPSSLPFLLPRISFSHGLDEKSEYATIFKWQPRDTLLNALFASPPTSPACLPFLSPTPSLHRPTVGGPFWLPTRQRQARCSVPD